MFGVQKKTIKLMAAAATAAALFATPQAASASLIFDSTIDITAQGFGNAPRLLTLQERGKGDDVESGCVAAGSGGSISIGSSACISDARVFMGNGVTNTGGDEVNPQADNQKFGIPTLGELGFQDASDIGLLFNAIEPGGAAKNDVNVNDVTLKFYDSNGRLIDAIDGQQYFATTETGNGRAGNVFVVDAEQQIRLNSTVFSLPNFSDIRIALESTISAAQAGPESFSAVNLGRSSSGGSTGGTPVPAPAGLGLFAIAAAGLIGFRRKKSA
nr:PEP-CTERM sorting domain-containing protein [uncultured Sphingosinicella sp.]